MRTLNNLNLLTKLAIPITIFVAVAIGLITLAHRGLNDLAQDTKDLVESEMTRLATTLQVNSEVNEVSTQEKNLILLSAAEPDRLKSAEKVYQDYKKLA